MQEWLSGNRLERPRRRALGHTADTIENDDARPFVLSRAVSVQFESKLL
jgi:hypothetical protein